MKVEKNFELPRKIEHIVVHVDDLNILEKFTHKQITSIAIYESYRLCLEYEVLRSSRNCVDLFFHIYLASFESTHNMLHRKLKLQGNVPSRLRPRKRNGQEQKSKNKQQ